MPERERPETAAPTKVVKMKLAPAAKPGASSEPKLAVGSAPTQPAPGLPRPALPRPKSLSKPPPSPPSDATQPDVNPLERSGSEPATSPIVAGTQRASVAPPPRPSPIPAMRKPVSPVPMVPVSASAPRVSSALVSPAALAARAVHSPGDGPPLRNLGTTAPGGAPEATAIVRRLPRPEGSTAASLEAPVSDGRRKRVDLGKWLIGGAVAAGALVVAIFAGAFDRPSIPGPAASAVAPSEEQPPPRKKPRVTEDPELRSPNDPPRTVGNTPIVDPSGSPAPAQAQEPPAPKQEPEASPPATKPADEPSPEAARNVAAEPPPATKPADEPPPETAKRVAAEPPPTTKPADEPPPVAAKPAVTPKATPPAAAISKPPAVATKPPAVATKPPPQQQRRKPPATKPPATKPTTTPPKWDPDSLFLK
jgi:hypothetical protein